MHTLKHPVEPALYKNKQAEDYLENESIVFRDEVTTIQSTGEVSLLDLMLTEVYRKLSEDTVLFIDIDNPDNKMTYGQFKERALKCAASLKREYGLQSGDVIAVCSPDSIEYAILFYGALAAGCVFSPMRHSAISTAEDIVYDFHTLQPKLLILHASEMNTLYSAARDSGLPESNILALGDRSKDPAYANVRTVNDVLFSSKELAEPYRYTRDEIVNNPCFLLFTSGSTGRRKAVILTQNALVYYMMNNRNMLNSFTSTLSVTGFSFASSLFTCIICPIFFGITVHILDHSKRSLENVCKNVEKYKVDLLVLPPFMIYSLGKDDKISQTYDLSSLKLVGAGGSTSDRSMLSLVKEKTGINILNMYAMTECIAVTSNDLEGTLVGSVGRLRFKNLARIVDTNGKDQPAGSIGELRIKGPTMTPGYYRNPEATAELFDDQGYLRTGDLCKMGEDGRIYYITRFKDLIKHKMFYFYPVDVEKVLITHPSVSDCAVVGIDSKEHGTEVARAYVTLVDNVFDKSTVLNEIKKYTEAQLPESKHLHGGIFELESFPRTESGKIQRFELRQQAKEMN
ncbi:hypothetical protein G6F56_001847 [Rhizopus delemar]|nr:hypothetical protein G6F56_001847 [Rhizopus delemar]